MRVFQHASMPTPISISVSISHRWHTHTLRVLNLVCAVPVVDFGFLRIQLVLNAQDLASPDIQRLVVYVLVLFVLPVRRVVAIVVQGHVGKVPQFVFASSVRLDILRATLANVHLVGPLIPGIGVGRPLFLIKDSSPVQLVIVSALVIVLRAQALLAGKKLALAAAALGQVPSLFAGRVDADVGVVDRLVHRVTLLLIPDQRPISLRRRAVVVQ